VTVITHIHTQMHTTYIKSQTIYVHEFSHMYTRMLIGHINFKFLCTNVSLRMVNYHWNMYESSCIWIIRDFMNYMHLLACVGNSWKL
jgi:hypothetical protein